MQHKADVFLRANLILNNYIINKKYRRVQGDPYALIFTDLDGSLLDHNTYSSDPASQLLKLLEISKLPVIAVTSKTASEVIPLREDLENKHPFIIENGAAIYIPKEYFSKNLVIKNCDTVDKYIRISEAPSRDHWRGILHDFDQRYRNEFRSFSDIYNRDGAAGICEVTGLSLQSAKIANKRDYTEPLIWEGNEERKIQFIQELRNVGANPLQGGRFLTVGGAFDKGSALKKLISFYKSVLELPIISLAVGDSANDVSMLDVASWALLIRAKDRALPSLSREGNVLISDHEGPKGWDQGVRKWLRQINYELGNDNNDQRHQ